MAYRVKVYSYTENGKLLADKICQIKADYFRGEKLIFCNDDNLIDEDIFNSYNAHLFIGAVGIAVRKTAPFISSKYEDAAVIVVDEKGQFVIPVLSGHIGGANSISQLIAEKINATAVLTTSSDVNGYNAIDKIVSEYRLTYSPIDCIRRVNKKIINGEKIKVSIGENIAVKDDTSGIYEVTDSDDFDVRITNDRKYVIGIGCKKNTDSFVFRNTVNGVLSDNNIRHEEIDRISSIDLKSEEKAIVDYASTYNLMFETYSADELNSIDGEFDESEFVKEITGVSNVSERAAAFAGSLMGQGEFVLKRFTENGITISILKVIKRIDLNGKA